MVTFGVFFFKGKITKMTPKTSWPFFFETSCPACENSSSRMGNSLPFFMKSSPLLSLIPQIIIFFAHFSLSFCVPSVYYILHTYLNLCAGFVFEYAHTYGSFELKTSWYAYVQHSCLLALLGLLAISHTTPHAWFTTPTRCGNWPIATYVVLPCAVRWCAPQHSTPHSLQKEGLATSTCHR